MTMDTRGNNHKAAGRPDGGQFDRKVGQGSDDDLDFDTADTRLAEAMPDMDADARRRLVGAVMGGSDPFAENGLDGLPDDAKAMARIMAARGGDQVYRDLAEYNKAIGYRPEGTTPAADASAAPSMLSGVTFTPETFKGLVSGGMRDFHGADLHGLDLTGYDLKELNLDGVNLTGANLDHADLSGASLEGAKLDGARFTHVKADGIDLAGAGMRNADLSHTIIRGRSSLVNADLTGARLDGLRVEFDGASGFVDASGITMRNTVGTDVGFRPNTLIGGDFTNARWDGGDVFIWEEMEGVVLENASFTNMGEFNLCGSYRGVDLSGSLLVDSGSTDLSGAILRNAFFGGDSALDWRDDVSFRDADLRGCAFGPTFGPPADATRLSYDLRGAKLEGARCWDLKGRTGIRTDRDPEGREPFDPAAYGMEAVGYGE